MVAGLLYEPFSKMQGMCTCLDACAVTGRTPEIDREL
jgi:hypothetical protein